MMDKNRQKEKWVNSRRDEGDYLPEDRVYCLLANAVSEWDANEI